MRIMMQMMEQGQGNAPNSQQLEQIAREQTLELNAGHPLILNLNKLRKMEDKRLATLIARQMLDNVLAQSGIPYDVREGTERQYAVLEGYVELLTRHEGIPALEQQTIELEGDALKQARNETKSGQAEEIIIEHTVTGDEHKK